MRWVECNGVCPSLYDTLSQNSNARFSVIGSQVDLGYLAWSRSMIFPKYATRKQVLQTLIDTCVQQGTLKPHPKRVLLEESLAIFLLVVGQGYTYPAVSERLQRSTETISNHFHYVLRAICRLGNNIITLVDPSFQNTDEALQANRLALPAFKDCIGAIDGALSDAELNDFQVNCFNAPLQPSEIVDVKEIVKEQSPERVNDRGLTLTGFLFLHELFIRKGRSETTWTVLRKFGYNNDIKLADDLMPSLKRSPDQSVELTNESIEFLKGIFEVFDTDGDGVLQPLEVEELFSTAPDSPWIVAPYEDSAEKNAFGGISLHSFLSEGALMTLLNPDLSMENLTCIGYPGDPSSAIRVTRRRRIDRKKQRSDRNVYQCFVFGPKKAGKSALLNSFIGRPYSDSYIPTTDDRYAVNVVDNSQKTLILREIPEDAVKKLLSKRESLAACDVAVFLHDSSDECSWKAATELLVEVASHGENTGYGMPCLIVATKDDLDSFPMAKHESTRVSQDMGIEAPIPISSKVGDFNNMFHRIVAAAERPHLSIAESEAGRSRKLLNRSLMIISVGTAVAVVGLAAYRVYVARKNNS